MVRYKQSTESIAKMINFNDYTGQIYSNIDENKLITKDEFEQETFDIYSQDGEVGVPVWSYGENLEQINVASVINEAVVRWLFVRENGEEKV